MDGQKKRKTWRSEMKFSLGSKLRWGIKRVLENTRICWRQSGSLRLLRTSITVIVRNQLSTLSTVSTEVAAIQQRSSEVQKLHANQQDDKETVKGQDREGRYFEKKGRKEQGRSERQNCLVAELNLPIPHLSVQPEKSYVKSVEKKGITRSVANPSTNQLKFIGSKFFVCILHSGAALP